ncbi:MULTISPECIES: PDDEXK-like family protein [Comamonas]|nr:MULTISPECIES: PD-(D/E)XK nuclease family protein [Comamonas]
MSEIDAEQALERLMADDRLVQLCELQKTGDEVLDVISLSENQHSDILAWLLDPREGHGQGDQILRDLLVAASVRCASGESGLDGRGTTARFFGNWPPSRLRTTGFNAAFTARELGLKASERVDLFVIDPQNKFILLLENKAGATHNDRQLTDYRDKYLELVAGNPHLKEYAPIYLALDREYDVDDDGGRPREDAWLHLGYDWLKTSAARALQHVGRGNASARLVVSYCNRQTDWSSPESEQCTELAVALHHAYPQAVKRLLEFSHGRIEREWLTSRHPTAAHLFLLQNKSVASLLRETKGMASVKAALHGSLPDLPDDNIRHARAWLNICLAGWEQYEGEDWWPVYVSVCFSDEGKTRYDAWLVWSSRWARSEDEAERLRIRLIGFDRKFGQRSGSLWRRVSLGKNMTLPELASAVSDVSRRLDQTAPR